jgi:hypothetical protein
MGHYRRRTASVTIHRKLCCSPPPHLGEDLLLDVFGILFQGNYLGGHPIDHLSLLLSTVLKAFNHLGLSFHSPNKIVDHVGQLIDLNILTVNTAVQLIHHLPYPIGSIADKVEAIIQTVQRMVLGAVHPSNLVIQRVDLCQ